MKTKKEMFDNKKPQQAAEGTRVNKYLAEAGVCSRREADKAVADGKVLIEECPQSWEARYFRDRK